MNIKEVEMLAELAKISLTAEEKEELIQDMDSILAYVKQIEEVTPPEDGSLVELRNVWRYDVEGEKNNRDLILEQFPEQEGDYLKVKKIL